MDEGGKVMKVMVVVVGVLILIIGMVFLDGGMMVQFFDVLQIDMVEVMWLIVELVNVNVIILNCLGYEILGGEWMLIIGMGDLLVGKLGMDVL